MKDSCDHLSEAIRLVVREQLGHSPSVRRLACELARMVLREAERIEHGESAEHSDGPEGSACAASAGSDPSNDEDGTARLRSIPLEIGGSSAVVEVADTGTHSAPPEPARDPQAQRSPLPRQDGPLRDIDLAIMAQRCRLKAESCRLFILRRSARDEPDREAGLISEMDEMIARAKSMDRCFLWVFWPHQEQPSDSCLEMIADCYDALGASADLCTRVLENDGGLKIPDDDILTALSLMAEACSALRAALSRTWLTDPDRDQDDAHLLLRRETFDRQIYVQRYMTIDDAADPARAGALGEEIRAELQRHQQRKRRAKRIESLFNKARYHARKLPETGMGDEHDRCQINRSIEQLRGLGICRGDERLAEIARLARADAFGSDDPRHPLLDPPAQPRGGGVREAGTAPKWSERVLKARELIRGTRMVIIGGEPRCDAIERISGAFGLDGVDWVELSEHGPSQPMRAPIARPETSLVLLLIKLTGHLHAESARQLAREYSKPCVHLTAGYNPEQIADSLLGQASDRLA